jgi:hypothetical protein
MPYRRCITIPLLLGSVILFGLSEETLTVGLDPTRTVESLLSARDEMRIIAFIIEAATVCGNLAHLRRPCDTWIAPAVGQCRALSIRC